MMKSASVFTFVVVAAISCGGAVHAQDPAEHTYVSLSGTDAGDPGQQAGRSATCSRPRPCKTITYALTRTRDKGTITLLDGGEPDDSPGCTKPYQSVIVKQSVTIEAAADLKTKPCFVSDLSNGYGVATMRGRGIALNITLRGLRFIGDGGYVGVSIGSGSEISVEKCYFNGLNHGIVFDTEGALLVKDSTIAAGTGIRLDESANRKSALIIHCVFFSHNNSAIEINSNGSAKVSDSDFRNMDLAFRVNGTGSLLVQGGSISNVDEILKIGPLGSIEITNSKITKKGP
ncbi:MAG: right-handed parallel beta-helix repeat-containing protein [Acidobacteria bacterium]|nr:right-handed parallel beta-helix repeat-containing protein [Acidobacteriota bacterium]